MIHSRNIRTIVALAVVCLVSGLALAAGAVAAPLLDGNPSTPGEVSGPCDEAEHVNDPRCVDVTVPAPPATAPTTTAPATPVGATTGTVRAAAGTVAYAFDGSDFTLVDAAPAAGWTMRIDHAGGPEIEVKFFQGSVRVDVNIELDDGMVRERVRTRDDADDSETRVENGVTTRTDDTDSDDSGGHGSDEDSDDDDSDDHGDDDHGDDDHGDDSVDDRSDDD